MFAVRLLSPNSEQVQTVRAENRPNNSYFRHYSSTKDIQYREIEVVSHPEKHQEMYIHVPFREHPRHGILTRHKERVQLRRLEHSLTEMEYAA